MLFCPANTMHPSYGPKGEYIILTTLDCVFKDVLSTLLSLAIALKDVFQTEIVNCEPGESYHHFWEGVNSDFSTSPISLHDFFDYVLPETTLLLIAQDLYVRKAERIGIWAQSKDYGIAFNGNIDDISNKSIKAQTLVLSSSCHLLLFLIKFTHFRTLKCVETSNGPPPPQVGRKGWLTLVIFPILYCYTFLQVWKISDSSSECNSWTWSSNSCNNGWKNSCFQKPKSWSKQQTKKWTNLPNKVSIDYNMRDIMQQLNNDLWIFFCCTWIYSGHKSIHAYFSTRVSLSSICTKWCLTCNWDAFKCWEIELWTWFSIAIYKTSRK